MADGQPMVFLNGIIVSTNHFVKHNNTFIEANYIRKISKLLTGSPEDMIVPIPTFVCTKCSHVNEQFKIKMPEPKIIN